MAAGQGSGRSATLQEVVESAQLRAPALLPALMTGTPEGHVQELLRLEPLMLTQAMAQQGELLASEPKAQSGEHSAT
jgi:hypothetical protein